MLRTKYQPRNVACGSTESLYALVTRPAAYPISRLTLVSSLSGFCFCLTLLLFFVSLTLSLVLTSPCTLNCADRHGAPPSGVDLLACRRRAKHTFCCCLSLSPALFFHTVPPSSDVAQGRLPPWLDVSHRGASKIGRVRTLIVLAGGFNV